MKLVNLLQYCLINPLKLGVRRQKLANMNAVFKKGEKVECIEL